MAVNAEGTRNVHYEDRDTEAGKPWARVRAAAVDAESGEGGELEGGEEEEEDGELEEGMGLGGQSTFEMEAIAALAWCSEGSVGVHAAAAIEDGEENGDEVAFAFGGKGGGSLSSSSADTEEKKWKRQKQVSAKERSGEEVPVSSSKASAMRSPSLGR